MLFSHITNQLLCYLILTLNFYKKRISYLPYQTTSVFIILVYFFLLCNIFTFCYYDQKKFLYRTFIFGHSVLVCDFFVVLYYYWYCFIFVCENWPFNSNQIIEKQNEEKNENTAKRNSEKYNILKTCRCRQFTEKKLK